MFKDFGSFLFESTDSEERQKEKDQAEKLKKAKAAVADAKSKLDSTENDKEASDEDRAEAKLIYIKNTAIVTQLETDAKLKALKDSQITAEDIAEVLVKMQEKHDAELKALKDVIEKAKLTASQPKLPLGEFKQDKQKHLLEAFRELDQDGDGFIPKNELTQFM